jgi:hypothetical protein
MLSKTNTPSLIAFPTAKPQPVTKKDKRAAAAHDAAIQEICHDSSQALEEIRHGVANVLRDTLEKMGADQWTLVQLLDERPSVVKDIMAGETDELTTETLIAYLEKLRA